MAENTFNPINYVGFQNPMAALKLQQQQALATQLMADAEPRKDINATIGSGPYAQVAPYSPLEGASKALEKGLGGFLQGKSTAQLADALQSQSGSTQSDPSAPTIQERYAEALQPGMGKTMLEARLKNQYAGPTKLSETKNTPYLTAQNTYEMGSDIVGGNNAASPNSPSPAPSPQITSQPLPPISGQLKQGTPAGDQAINDVFGGNEGSAPPTAPVNLYSDKQSPKAADGKPLLPDINSIPIPDPSGTPKFKTENTKTGVEQTIQDQKDAAEGNKAFAATAQNLGQENARLDNLINVYKDVQSGTLTAQNPEFFNKMAALGFRDDPKSIKDLAGIQNATQNHILQVIQQIKDTNATAGGGAPTRTFGSEITKLLEDGESSKGQPEALWNVIGQAKGLVDHHLDMVKGWNTVGGLGNRLAGGYTMRPDDYAQQFSLHHNISDYRDAALKKIGPFKGMPGNTGKSLPPGITDADVAEYKKLKGIK